VISTHRLWKSYSENQAAREEATMTATQQLLYQEIQTLPDDLVAVKSLILFSSLNQVLPKKRFYGHKLKKHTVTAGSTLKVSRRLRLMNG
jgi:hypothetical protein